MKKNYGKGKRSYSRPSDVNNTSPSATSNNTSTNSNNPKKSNVALYEKILYRKDYLDAREASRQNDEKAEQTKSTTNSAGNSKHMAKKGGIGFFKVLFIILLILVIGIVIFFIPYISIAISSYESGLDTTRIDVETVPHIYDKDGNLICIMYGYYDSGEDGFVATYSSVYTDISSLPSYVGDAFTAIEDETFYDNSGISVNRLLYATFNYVINGDSSFGGSTITQQLVKVATGDDSHSPARKAREIGSALYLTDNWSKSKILASYMNLVYYGNGAYGIYEASMTYFNTTPENLNIAQAAILAAIPNSPETLNPYGSDSNRTKLFNRQKLVLQKMLELGLITDDEYTEAVNYEITFSNGSSSLAKNDPAISAYIEIALEQTIDLVKETYSCDSEEAIDIVLNGSTKIYLNMDTDLQKQVYEIAKSSFTDDELELGGVISTKSGQVLAIISSRTGSEVDHAYSMTRQTGSAIKPLSVYGPAYDLGILTPTSTAVDSPVTVTTSSGTWNVTNASNTFRGTVTINEAIAYSLNTVAVTTLEKVGISKSYEYLKSFGITSIDSKNDMYYPALALGGLTYGISPYEMTQAYNAISNDGTYRNISTINYVELSGVKISPAKNEHQVISADAASMLKTSLNAVATYGTGKTANLSNTTAYLKTGTTNDVKDVWTCGFTNDVTMCLWAGYDTPAKLSIYNVNTVWKSVMEYYYSR